MFHKSLRSLLFSAVLIALVPVLPAKLVVNNYSDTGLPYISQDYMQSGKFSNSMTEDADMDWYIIITDEDVSIVVYYYGAIRLERSVGGGVPVYKVTAVDDRGKQSVFTGKLYSDRIMIEEDWEFRTLMRDTSYMDLSLELVDGAQGYSLGRFSYDGFVGLYALTYGFRPEKPLKGMYAVEAEDTAVEEVMAEAVEEIEEPVEEAEPSNEGEPLLIEETLTVAEEEEPVFVEPVEEAEPSIEEEPVLVEEEEVEPIIEEAAPADESEETVPPHEAKRSKAINPFITAGVNGGYIIPLSGDGDIRVGVEVIGYLWSIKGFNIGLRGDVSAFSYGSDTVYSKFDASAGFYASYFFNLAEDMGLGIEAGLGFGYLMDRTGDDTSHGGFLRLPVALSYSLDNGFQVALGCLVDFGTDSLDKLGELDLDVTFTPALSVRYAF